MSEIGFKAASRIWFGFMWRSFVLTMPVMLAVEAASWALMPHLSPGEPLRRRQFEAFIEQGVLIWIPFMFVEAFRDESDPEGLSHSRAACSCVLRAGRPSAITSFCATLSGSAKSLKRTL